MEEKKTAKKSTWSVLSAINVNEHVEKKPSENGRELSYLSWAWAWGVLKENYPDASYSVREWEGKPYLFDENLGYLVETSLTVDGVTMSMRLPVMDAKNKAQRHVAYKYGKYQKTVEAATMFDINTAIMRCLVKNMALFGLGHYIYAGEDLPSVEMEEMRQEEAKNEDELREAIYMLDGCKTIDELKGVYEKYPKFKDDKRFKNAINERAKQIHG